MDERMYALSNTRGSAVIISNPMRGVVTMRVLGSYEEEGMTCFKCMSLKNIVQILEGRNRYEENNFYIIDYVFRECWSRLCTE